MKLVAAIFAVVVTIVYSAHIAEEEPSLRHSRTKPSTVTYIQNIFETEKPDQYPPLNSASDTKTRIPESVPLVSQPGTCKCDGEMTLHSANTSALHCLAGDFRCNDGSCIRAAYRCDYIDDCLDGSDEQNCSEKSKRGMYLRNERYLLCKIDLEQKEKKYTLRRTKVIWYEGLLGCFLKGQKLATIYDKEDNDKLVELLNRSNITVTDVWLAALHFDSDGTFKWVSTGMPVTYTDWVPNGTNQSDDRKEDEDCVHLHKFEDHGFRWENTSCFNKHYFACESF